MNWFRRLREQNERRTSTLATPDAYLMDAFSAGPTISGQRVTVDRSLGLASVWAAVKLISETVGGLPLKVYRDLEDGDRIEARQHRCWRMLHDQPNPVQPAHRFWATATAHYLLWGNVFVEKLRNELGLVDELWLLPPADVAIEWDSGLRRKRFYQDTMEGRKYWTDEEVLHLVGFSTDGLVGRSPISTARNSLGTALAREDFEAKFYRGGGSLHGVLTSPKDLSPEAQNRLKAQFAQMREKGLWPLLEDGVSAENMSMPLEDMQFVESKNLGIRDVANLFNLPVSFLNGSSGDSLTYATVESNQIQFAQITISPIVNAISKALAADPAIFPQTVFFPEFVIDGIHRGDMNARVSYYEKMSGIGALSINEIRAIENYPPVTGGDKVGKPEPPPPPAIPAPPPAATEGEVPVAAA